MNLDSIDFFHIHYLNEFVSFISVYNPFRPENKPINNDKKKRRKKKWEIQNPIEQN